MLGLPAVDAQTVRLAPDVVGEKLTWRSGPRAVTAWVGVHTFESFQDLDLVSVEVAETGGTREWTTRVRPDVFVVEVQTGHPPPCDVLYVSTEGFPRHTALEVVASLRVVFGAVGQP